MTPDQIRQIAEEFGKYMSNNVLYQESYADDAERVFEFLTERYCVVERSKVEALEAEIHCAIMDAHNDDDMQMVAHEVLDVMPRRFAAIFGSETFNKKEE